MNIEEILAASTAEHLLPSHDIPQKQAHALSQLNGAERFRAAAATKPKLQADMDQCLEKVMPSLPPGATYKVTVTILPKAKPGSSAVKKALIRCILSPTSVDKTQEQCSREVLAQHPGHTLSKDWNKPLPDWLRHYAQAQIWGSAAPINQASLPKGTSLSSLHRQVKDLVASSASNSQTFTVKITVTPDALVLNGLTFKVTTSKSGGYTYQYARVNIQSLTQAM